MPLQVDREAIARNAERYSRVLRRGSRLALGFLIGLAVLELWGLDVLRLLGAPGAGAVWKAAFDIAVVVLLAYLVWQLIETALTRSAGPEARAQTLLPLIRKFILIVIAVMVAMIALSSIGVDIGPLLAGAGVVGLAIGFGAQALVRDVVAGVFFLVDDAFRVGEYIEVDEKIRGEVEAISVRSLRLRHHRGAVITLPFGELKQITNHNRDWTIYKMPIRVAADTDPKAVKKIVKQIGKEMLADPELGPKLIQPLKSQGVFAIDDDSALIIRVKFMCKPRQQFVLRREAYHRIQNAFAAHGIEIARRKVEVSVPEDAGLEERRQALRGAGEAAETASASSGTSSAAEAI
jgi:small-conductance mechanosensitive channel